MMRPALALGLVVLTVAALQAADVKIDVKVDKSATFKGPRTYVWLETPPYTTSTAPDVLRDERLEKEALDGPIRAAVDRELTARGWRPAAAGQEPDFKVVYYAIASVGVNASVLGSYYQYTTGWAPMIYGEGGIQTSGMSFVEKGTIVIDLIDRARNTAVWRGTASGTLDRTREQVKRLEVISDAITRLFRKLPTR